LKKSYKIQFSLIPLYLKNKTAPFWYEYDEDERILYCQYNICWSDNDKYSYSDYDFDKFYDEIINIVKNNKLDKFIFDVRFNTGGNSSTGTELIKKISKYKDNIGKSFVIIGRNTFSSAILNAYDALEYLDAVSVGEATWGQPNSYGEIKYLTLPNSGISVSYSTKFFKETNQKVNSLIPEIPVKLSFDDYIEGKDPSLEAIKDYE
jgi:C-terminal processing protease CtpA/Prc